MKILHTSDWHLGKTVFLQSMLDDQEYYIDNVFLPALDSYSPDVIILAGDIFDRSIAPVQAISLFERTLYRVAERGIPLIAVSGNHDGPERLLPAARLLRKSGIYLANSMEDFLSPVDITAADGSRARFFCLPYFDLSTAKRFTGNDGLDSPNDAFRTLFEMAADRLAPDCPNILTAHCTVAGSLTAGSESTVSVGGVEQVSSDLFGCFELTCLGHIHSPQRAGGTARYCGAPLRYSFDANEHDKIMLLYDTSDGMSVTEIPVVPKRDMRTVTGSFRELMDVPDNCSQDYILAVIDDDHPVYEPSSRLREKYPNLLNIHQTFFDRASDANGGSRSGSQAANSSMSDTDLFVSFLRDIYDAEPDEDDIAFFNEINRRIGEGEN